MSDIPEGFRPARIPAPFVEASGPFHWRDADGDLILGFRVEKRHLNTAGNLHGGMLMTLVDMQLNCALSYQLDTDQFIPTMAATIDFLAPAAEGDWVEGRTEILRRGKRTIFADCRIRRGDGELMARASGIFKLGGSEYGTFDPRAAFS
ncbi:MAG: hypothetical protein TEF_06300 [Rhizobiales bacterium NRL2]|mgnify:CR=1 FL=1|jgi:uncharacterized protein (TIGR00369 family)|nr:MAG: hypothetical protein TEF_06300 [Rhizobiales bacterium NRL2]